MKFIDEVKINILAGNGGNGAVSFRREKFVPFGGPDGGEGGTGGDIVFKVDEGKNTLMHFRGRKDYKAQHGQNGSGHQSCGRRGDDFVLRVPPGTLVINDETGNLLADLTDAEQVEIVAKGGRGGHGNTYFKSATNQSPSYAQVGEEGEVLTVRLELKLLADIALIGLPNAGKSTLISTISAAKPKIADYPFTTLEPNLGVVQVDEDTIVVADIPGLIEDAADGKGLGHKFLRHIERTSALVHLVDCSMLLDPFEALDDYTTIRMELQKYSELLMHKKEIICLTKIDAMSEEEINSFVKHFEDSLDKRVLPISSVTGRNIDQLKRLMLGAKQAVISALEEDQ